MAMIFPILDPSSIYNLSFSPFSLLYDCRRRHERHSPEPADEVLTVLREDRLAVAFTGVAQDDPENTNSSLFAVLNHPGVAVEVHLSLMAGFAFHPAEGQGRPGLKTARPENAIGDENLKDIPVIGTRRVERQTATKSEQQTGQQPWRADAGGIDES